VAVSADYLSLRSAILRALQPFPEARAAVGRALAELETVAAQKIAQPKLIEGKTLR
jgi:hypothetical protein